MIVMLRCLFLVSVLRGHSPFPVKGTGSSGRGKLSSAAVQVKTIRQARDNAPSVKGPVPPKRPELMGAGVPNTCPADRLAAVVPAVPLPVGFKVEVHLLKYVNQLWLHKIIAPHERLWEPCRTKEWDDKVLFDHPPAIGQVFAILVLLPGEFLLPIGLKKFDRLWKAAILFLGLLAKTVAYQLQHGGANEDCLSKRRSIEIVMVGSRSRIRKGVRLYTKPGQMQRLLSSLPVKAKRHCTKCAKNLELLLSKKGE